MPFDTKEKRNAWYKQKVYRARLERERENRERLRRNENSSSDSDLDGQLPPGVCLPEGAIATEPEPEGAIATENGSSDSESSSNEAAAARCDLALAESSAAASETITTTTATAASEITTTTTTKTSPNTVISLEAQLFDFMCDHHITHSSMRALLSILNRELPFRELPANPRTLMNRYVKNNELASIVHETENFAYIGISNAFLYLYAEKKHLLDEVTTIKIALNFDGLPTSKSSTKEVWPILMSTDVCPDLVHVLGVYYDDVKPNCEQLLRDLVNELGPLLNVGFTFPDKKVKTVLIEFIVCDLPAVSLVKSIKGHTGYASCPKCTVYGQWLRSRMTFIPVVHNALILEGQIDVPPVAFRTNESFREQSDKEHHKGVHKMKTPFMDLDIDMVSLFTIDGMHTIYAGVVRRFLHFLQHSKRNVDPDEAQNKKTKNKTRNEEAAENAENEAPEDQKQKKKYARNLISEKQFNCMGDYYASSKNPREFSRSVRNFEHFDMWKCTELRAFLLYGGDIAMGYPAAGVPPVLVTAFRCFSMAIRLLSDPATYIRYNQFAKSLLVCFVDTTTEYFGRHFISLIVHLLLHLPDECMKYGQLDRFSCWKFENALKSIKKRCRNYKTPLKALANQLRYKSTFISRSSRASQHGGAGIHLIRPYEPEADVKVLDGESFKTLFLKNFVLTIEHPDCYFMSKSRQVYVIRDIVKPQNGPGTMFVCQSFDKTEYAYYVPTAEYRVESTEIGIKKLSKLNPNVHLIDVYDFYQKCLVRKYEDSLYAYPIMLLQ